MQQFEARVVDRQVMEEGSVKSEKYSGEHQDIEDNGITYRRKEPVGRPFQCTDQPISKFERTETTL